MFSRFLKGNSGIAAIEFALILPLLVTLFLGMMTAYDAVRGYNSASKAATSVSNLTARLGEVSDDDATNLKGAAKAFFGSYADNDQYGINIAAVSYTQESGFEIDWQDTGGAISQLTLSKLSTIELPSITEGQNIIVVRSKLSFKPLFSPASISVGSSAIASPRFVKSITRN